MSIIKIISYNILWKNMEENEHARNNVIKLLQKDYDIICIQECSKAIPIIWKKINEIRNDLSYVFTPKNLNLNSSELLNDDGKKNYFITLYNID